MIDNNLLKRLESYKIRINEAKNKPKSRNLQILKLKKSINCLSEINKACEDDIYNDIYDDIYSDINNEEQNLIYFTDENIIYQKMQYIFFEDFISNLYHISDYLPSNNYDEISLKNILYIDNNIQNTNILGEITNFFDNYLGINYIFAEGENKDYYRILSIFNEKIKSFCCISEILEKEINEQYNSYRSGEEQNKKFFIIDNPHRDLIRNKKFRELVYNGLDHGIGHILRIGPNYTLPFEIIAKYNIIILNPTDLSNFELLKIYMNFFEIFYSFDIFLKLINKLREKNEIIVYYRNSSNNLFSKIFKIEDEVLY